MEEALVADPASAESIELRATTNHESQAEVPWEDVPDGTSGKVYYYNKETGKATWDREPRDQAQFHVGRNNNPLLRGRGEEIAGARLSKHTPLKN